MILRKERIDSIIIYNSVKEYSFKMNYSEDKYNNGFIIRRLYLLNGSQIYVG